MEGQYCVDLLNNTVLPSKIYSPGPDPCTSCTCDNGAPTYCKVITCATPKNCRLVHPHTTCCNFECHENLDLSTVTLGGPSPPDRVLSFNELTLRFVVIAFTVFVSMSLVAFLVHRLKKRKLRGRQARPLGVEDNRIGYIEGSIRGSIRYLPEYVAYEPPHAALWKPHGYFPAGEAPPPYEEAVAAARAEAALQTHSMPSETPSLGIVSTVTMPYHRTIPLNLLSGNSHGTTTTTAVIVRSNVHYDTLPQASQTNAIENTRHPSLSRNSTASGGASNAITAEPPPSTHSHHPPQTTSCHQATAATIKSPSFQPSPKTPTAKHPKPPQSTSGACLNPQNIYANVPSTPPVTSNASFMGATCKERSASYGHASEKYYAEKAHANEKSERLACKTSVNSHYAKCDRSLESAKYERTDGTKYERTSDKYDRTPDSTKYDRTAESTKYDRSMDGAKYERNPENSKVTNKHEYIYVSTKPHDVGTNKSELDRVRPSTSDHGHHSHSAAEHAHHSHNAGDHGHHSHNAGDHGHHSHNAGDHAHHAHKKHKKVQHSTNSIQRNLTMPKTGKTGKTGVGKNLHTNYLALEKQYDQILKNTLKQTPTHAPHPASHHDRRNGASTARASVSTISSSYGSHHTTIPNYFTSPSLPPPPSDVIKPPSIYKSSTTPTLLSHLSNSNPILSMSLDSNDEDYIDECENCRSDVIPTGDESSRMQDLETMTLQRSRPNCYEDFTEEKFTSTSLTLPTHCRVQRPSAMNNGPPPVINRFSSILSQSSLSEEDD